MIVKHTKLLVLILTIFGNVAVAQPPAEPLSLWYRQPAKQWVEALAVGNGRLGAMVFGGVAQERIQLNEDTLWAGGPYDPANPDALEALPKVRISMLRTMRATLLCIGLPRSTEQMWLGFCLPKERT